MRTRLTAVGLSLVLSSNAWADLRIFDVGVQHQQEIYVALGNVLNPATVGGGNPYGTVQQLPNGQLLVNAPPQVLQQVEQVVTAIRERPVAAAPRVSLRYWAVLGTQAQGAAANAIGSAPPPALNAVLTELKRLNGELTFRVIGTAAVTSDSGQKGEVNASTMSVSQQTQVQGDTLNAYMRINVQSIRAPESNAPRVDVQGAAIVPTFPIGELELRTSLKRGEFVVLGESQAQGNGVDGPVFYIVHWAE
ncbi:MAG TPA: hypothetical protein VM692_14850 [Gammaproteobacteria bacterium]|nr:hypothetical protein [Gammaproteobacteria bacterium]